MCRLKKKTDLRQKLLRFDHSVLRDDNVSAALCEEVLNNVNQAEVSYSNLSSSVAKAVTTVLPKSDCAKPGWFKAKEAEILPLIKARNSAMAEIYSSAKRTRAKTLKSRATCRKLKRTLSSAKINGLHHSAMS